MSTRPTTTPKLRPPMPKPEPAAAAATVEPEAAAPTAPTAVVVKERRKRRPPSVATVLVGFATSSIVFSAVAVFLFLGVLPRTGAYKTLTVLSGSMVPAFRPGDMVVAEPTSTDSLKVGDVLVYSIPIGDHHVESHRVVKIVSRNPLTVITKGDANEKADPWTAQLDGSRVWTVRHSVPYVGQGILWLRSPAVHRWFTIFVPALVVILVLRGIWRRPEEDALLDANVHRA